jgi:hypothetical protein
MMVITKELVKNLSMLQKICSDSDDFSINIANGGFDVYWKTIHIKCGNSVEGLCEVLTACQTLDRYDAQDN